MATAKHVLIAAVLVIIVAVSFYFFAFFGWLTAYYTREEMIREAQIRSNIWFAVLVAALVGLFVDAWSWWRSRRKVG